MTRALLFLQGVISPFFARLAGKLRRDGHQVFRVNFSAGDALDWGRSAAWNYRGTVAEWPAFLQDKHVRHDLTDLVVFGDQRPLHRVAVEWANSRGLRVLVFEEGYVRPNWITLDRGGVNALSPLPRDPQWYRAVDKNLPRYGEGLPTPSNLARRVAYDLAHQLANAINPLAFPRYRTHRPRSPWVEYAGWIQRYALLSRTVQADREAIAALISSRTRYYFLPLQLNSDAQIRTHSPFSGMIDVITQVAHSFAIHASTGAKLVIKNHPLDTGLVPYRQSIRSLERDLALDGRLLFLESGHLPTLLEHAQGVITVNSTTGMSSLVHECPTIALGQAIYDLPGLTFQGSLDHFWTDAARPDLALYHAFRNTVIHTTQANGSFYEPKGIALAIENSARLMGVRSPLDELLA